MTQYKVVPGISYSLTHSGDKEIWHLYERCEYKGFFTGKIKENWLHITNCGSLEDAKNKVEHLKRDTVYL